MFILNHVVLDVENNEVSVANFLFNTLEEAQKAETELNHKYDLVKLPNCMEKVFTDIREVNVSTDNTDVLCYLHELNDLKYDLDDNYTDTEYKMTKEQINS